MLIQRLLIIFFIYFPYDCNVGCKYETFFHTPMFSRMAYSHAVCGKTHCFSLDCADIFST